MVILGQAEQEVPFAEKRPRRGPPHALPRAGLARLPEGEGGNSLEQGNSLVCSKASPERALRSYQKPRDSGALILSCCFSSTLRGFAGSCSTLGISSVDVYRLLVLLLRLPLLLLCPTSPPPHYTVQASYCDPNELGEEDVSCRELDKPHRPGRRIEEP